MLSKKKEKEEIKKNQLIINFEEDGYAVKHLFPDSDINASQMRFAKVDVIITLFDNKGSSRQICVKGAVKTLDLNLEPKEEKHSCQNQSDEPCAGCSC